MSQETYYIKKGRRYVPVSYYDSDVMNGYPVGTHLITVIPGGQSRKYNIDPAFAPMIAAAEFARNKMCDALVKASEGNSTRPPLTPKQKAAIEQLKLAFGDELFYIQYPSANECVLGGLAAMQEEADKLLKHPGVKKAYDNFLLMAQLAYENKEV